MPTLASIVSRVFLYQQLVYWEKTGSDAYGKPTYTAPVQLPCRWEDKPQELIMPDGRKVHSRGYVLMVDRVLVGSLLFLGEFSDVPLFPDPPTVTQGAREVLFVRTTPDIKNLSNIYEVAL